MVSWEERITKSSDPSIQIEHELRYQFAVPIIQSAETWCDLGCGTGVAARRALKNHFAGKHIVLVDLEETALAEAKSDFSNDTTTAFCADLTNEEHLERVHKTLLDQPGPRAITCFETVEHLSTFVPLLNLLTTLANTNETTVLISVPNDEFWAIENPHHVTTWGEGAFAELKSLLPKEHVIAHQTSLAGSSILTNQHEEVDSWQAPELAFSRVPTHFLAGFGPQHNELHKTMQQVTQVDPTEQRLWTRQREANLELANAMVHDCETAIENAEKELSDYRKYIQELEERITKLQPKDQSTSS